MNPNVYFISVFTILACKIYFTSSSECIRLTETSGTIANEKRSASYAKCWSISVPLGSQALIDMESFTTSYDCSGTDVEVSSNNGNTYEIFCPYRRNIPWKSLVLDDDFTVTHRIEYKELITSKMSLKYQIVGLPCSREDSYNCSDGTCLLKSQKCDGIEQCSDGADEEDCGNGEFIVHDLDANRVSGIDWLKFKWSSSSGWRENTHRGIIALFLASKKKVKNLNLEEKLMVKQLEVQALVYLLRKETDPMTANQLSMFVNALTASCQNPRSFYGHDLVKLLKNEIEISSTVTRPVAHLALCNAGETLPVNATNDLSSVLKADAEYSILLDIQAVAVMALSCLKANNQDGMSDFFPQPEYEEAVRKLKALQLEDGSFGNIYTTAIVTQALLSAGQQNSEDWHYSKATNYLIEYLNSSSIDFLAAYLILPILNGKCLSDIRNINCSTSKQRDKVSDVKAKLGPKMGVQYSLYIGDGKDVVHTISLRVPENITLFDVMQLAQDADPKYKFRARKIGEKVYIYDIAGITNDFEDDKFWLLYVGKDTESLRHTNESSDKVSLQDRAFIVMWYKKAQI